MFKLEKVFQNNDLAYIHLIKFIKSFLILLSYYIFSILEKNSVYELLDFQIFTNSRYFYFSLLLSLNFFLLYSIFNKSSSYNKNFLSFLNYDILSLFLSYLIIFSLFFIFQKNFILDLIFLYSFFLVLLILSLSKIFFNVLYDYMIEKNIIQRNIMLVGNYDDIKKIMSEKFDKINIFKCCMILDLKNFDEKFVKSEIKFPIFKENDDIRSILEYHALGQIWLAQNKLNDYEKILSKIIKWSVDILIINSEFEKNLKGEKLLGNKFKFEKYEISRFHGINLFLKILIDKILSLFFLLISSPILLISFFTIYFEDGFPILFTQNRTGWDGRRFKIYKLRTLKKENFDKTKQVEKNDKRVLKFGGVLRRYSIDELPQFFNVFLGDMSIVGPRPHMVENDIYYSKLFDNFLKRHKCSPGLTGWAQVNGLRGATPNPENMKKRMEHDLWYLNNWTVFLDLYIMLKTFYVIFKYKGD